MANEKRLIDANALMAKLHKMPMFEKTDFDKTMLYVEKSIIETMPTVDAVEVVRCKDCAEWDKNEQECKHWYGFRANDFCSYGERKDNERRTD